MLFTANFPRKNNRRIVGISGGVESHAPQVRCVNQLRLRVCQRRLFPRFSCILMFEMSSCGLSSPRKGKLRFPCDLCSKSKVCRGAFLAGDCVFMGDMLLRMSEVTRILSRIESGDPSAAEQLLPLVYGELRKLASARMVSERPDHSLQPTALVHEAYLRLVSSSQGRSKTGHEWDDRGHFFCGCRSHAKNPRRKRAKRDSLKRGADSTGSNSAMRISLMLLILITYSRSTRRWRS